MKHNDAYERIFGAAELNDIVKIIDDAPESFRDFCTFLYENEISMAIIPSKVQRTIKFEFSKKMDVKNQNIIRSCTPVLLIMTKCYSIFAKIHFILFIMSFVMLLV